MPDQYPHIFLPDTAQQSDYTGASKRVEKNIPRRDRTQHVQFIQRKLDDAWRLAKEQKEHRAVVSLPTKTGTYLEFEVASGCELVTKSLEDRRAGIRLLNVREELVPFEEQPAIKATVYVPSGKEFKFINKLKAYADPEKDSPKSKKPKNADLINSINDVRLALLMSFWRDDSDLVPGDDPAWCEVWLQGEELEIEVAFREFALNSGMQLQDGALRFPERTVLLVKANRQQLAELIDSNDDLAEFRLAKETARFFLDFENIEQAQWVEDLRGRLNVSPNSSVAVCVLDTGANNGHPLLAPLLADDDCHTLNLDWGVHDHDGHGTLMCGLAGFRDLQQALESAGPVNVLHRLESVKILPPHGANDPELYGYITSQAVSRAEIQASDRSRFMCLAVTSEDGRDRGRPSSWSAAVDKITSGYDDGTKRLFIVSAGNVDECEEWRRYPESNLTNSIHDPAQSWNALTVGAYTEKVFLEDPDLAEYAPVAQGGSLSPFSTTSCDWDGRKWPTKPDIVMEGGNAVRAPDGSCSACDDMSLLSLSHEPIRHYFDWINATSAAVAQASWMAAQIQAHYPHAWPETIRGLMVHSAKWTDAMKADFLDSENKTDYAHLMRVCGYGVPKLQRALQCASNRLTLIAQETLQPFDRKPRKKSEYRTKDMHLYELPWPKDVLLSLAELEITMRITLSYFIEPSPGEIGWKDRYRYASHALRFDLNNPGESKSLFLKRLNVAAREEGEDVETRGDTGHWTVGANNRKLGSIHSDIWKGNAADLSTCNLIGIYPVIGWWRERAWLGRWNRTARYSLIVSFHTPEQHLDQPIDIYTPVAVQVGIPIIV